LFTPYDPEKRVVGFSIAVILIRSFVEAMLVGVGAPVERMMWRCSWLYKNAFPF
jgi:hypothetical protein